MEPPDGCMRNHCVEQGHHYPPHGERPQLAMAPKGVRRLRKDDDARPKLAITLDIIRIQVVYAYTRRGECLP